MSEIAKRLTEDGAVVVLHGELQMDMPSGETIIANAGELLVQQATFVSSFYDTEYA